MRSATFLPYAGWQDDGELFAAVPGQSVHRAHTFLEQLGYMLQGQIADVMTVGVIDGLEVIDVHHEEQGGIARAGYAVKLTFQHGHQLAPIGRAGQWIAQRDVAQAIDHCLQVSHGIALGIGQLSAGIPP